MPQQRFTLSISFVRWICSVRIDRIACEARECRKKIQFRMLQSLLLALGEQQTLTHGVGCQLVLIHRETEGQSQRPLTSMETAVKCCSIASNTRFNTWQTQQM